MALWVEKHHGRDGAQFIERKLAALAELGETGGVPLWQRVLSCYSELAPPIPIHGQDWTRAYSTAFEGGAVYHTNNLDFSVYYNQLFRQNSIDNVRFILTPALDGNYGD